MRIVQSCMLLLILVIAACGQREPGGGAVSVVATTGVVADLTRNVAGRRATVRGLLAPNADPHDYEPRPSDVKAVAEARLVLRSGGDLDDWMRDVTASAGADEAEVALIDSVAPGARDPHWWQDPRKAMAAVRTIRDRLTRVDPAGGPQYERNAGVYLAKLRRLDAAIRACMRRVRVDQRKLVATHDALGHFARRYDVEVIGAAIPSLSTQAQPSAGATARLIRRVRDEQVNAVFAESGVNPKLERAIASEAGARVGRPLWADALGPPGSGGATYLEAMASNTEAMVEGFTGGRQACRPDA